MTKRCDKCAKCREREDDLLKTLNSPYDVVIEMIDFRNECKRKERESGDDKYDDEACRR